MISPLDANTKRLKKNRVTYKIKSTIRNIIIKAKFLRKIIKKSDFKKLKFENLSNKIIIKKKSIYQPFVFKDLNLELKVKKVDTYNNYVRIKKKIDLLKDTFLRI